MPRVLARSKSKPLIAIGVICVVGLAAITNPRPVQASVAANDLRSTPFGDSNCQICDVCAGDNAHVAQINAQGLRGGNAHPCTANLNAGCDSGHPFQGGSCNDPVQPEGLNDLALAAAWQAAVSADLRDLPSVLARSNTNWQYNKERHAVQWPGCNGTIIANLPLSEDQARAVATALDALNH